MNGNTKIGGYDYSVGLSTFRTEPVTAGKTKISETSVSVGSRRYRLGPLLNSGEKATQ